LQAWARALNAT